jgi:hypothetical protein
MLKRKSKPSLPPVPRKLIWKQTIQGISRYALNTCVENIENLETPWYFPRPRHVYPLQADANVAEYVLTVKIGRGLHAWLFAELHAETSTTTRVQFKAGIDANSFTLYAFSFTCVSFVLGVIFAVTTGYWWSLTLGFLFLGMLWLYMKWVFHSSLVEHFIKAVGLETPN